MIVVQAGTDVSMQKVAQVLAVVREATDAHPLFPDVRLASGFK